MVKFLKIIEYNNSSNVLIEFQDKIKFRNTVRWSNVIKGKVRNPYYPSVYGVGIIGDKYPISYDNGGKLYKEYDIWHAMLCRCFDNKLKDRCPTYKDVTCCDEWLLYENFYEWLHSQENFEKWFNNRNWHLDKDILIKGNKIYSPENCCLVPQNINALFIKSDKARGDLPIGVEYSIKNKKYKSTVSINGKHKFLNYHDTIEEAFYSYKYYKEKLIKQVADEEYSKGNITRKCYDAMMKYQVEITD